MTDNIPTLPRPAPMPREEAPTPIPRRSSLEELRAGEDPYVALLDELRVEVLKLSASSSRTDEAVERSSQTNNAQQEKINELERWKKSLEENSSKAAEKSETTEGIAKAIAETVTTMAKPLRWNSPQVASLVSSVVGSILTMLLAGLVAYLRTHGMLP